MDLTYNELRKRDVINVVDGTCLGRICDLNISFPKGIMTGVYVPGRKGCFSKFFDRKQIYIDRSKIIKIGGDVILVNVNCGDTCSPSIPERLPPEKQSKSKPVCPPPCPSPCPPPCPPKPQFKSSGLEMEADFSLLSGGSIIDDGEY